MRNKLNTNFSARDEFISGLDTLTLAVERIDALGRLYHTGNISRPEHSEA